MFLYLHIYALVWILFSSNMLQTLPAINGHKRFYFELKPWIMETKHGLFLNRCMQTVVWIVSTHLQLELIFNMPVVLWSCFSMSYIFYSRWERPCSWGGAGRPKKGNRVAKAVFSNLPWHQENSRHPTTQEQVTVLAHGAVEEKEFVFTTSPKESEWEHVHRDIIKFIWKIFSRFQGTCSAWIISPMVWIPAMGALRNPSLLPPCIRIHSWELRQPRTQHMSTFGSNMFHLMQFYPSLSDGLELPYGLDSGHRGTEDSFIVARLCQDFFISLELNASQPYYF